MVTLTGDVETYWEKSAAEKAARKIKDVKAVAEDLRVRLPYGVKHDDENIASAAIDRLQRNLSVPKDAVQVKVEKGWITLTGEVDWHYQQDAVADDVRGLRGVVGVSNKITVKATPDTSKIKDKILVAMHRSWYNPANITVTAHGGIVTLSGFVSSITSVTRQILLLGLHRERHPSRMTSRSFDARACPPA